jgi:hypothetical protein
LDIDRPRTPIQPVDADLNQARSRFDQYRTQDGTQRGRCRCRRAVRLDGRVSGLCRGRLDDDQRHDRILRAGILTDSTVRAETFVDHCFVFDQADRLIGADFDARPAAVTVIRVNVSHHTSP